MFPMKFCITTFFALWLTLGGALAQTETTAPTDEAAPAAEAGGAQSTMWDIIMEATQGSAIIILALFALSIIAVMLIFYFFFALTKGRVASDKFQRTAETLIRKGDYLGLLAVANRNSEATAQVVGKSVDFITKNPDADFESVREVALAEGTRQASSLNQQISYLSDIGAIAPMLGLLGTVIGMIRSFTVLANDAVGSRPMMLAGGVSEALITTAAGLIVGIPAMLFYAYFRGRVQNLVSELEASSTHILSLLALSHKRKVVKAAETVESADVF
jgi:biopolymer transport protein ExbB